MKQFSHSSLSTFRNCPRKYFYGKIARIKTDDVPEQIYTFLGSRFHEAMEFLYGSGMNGVFPTLEEVVTRFDTLWNNSWDDSITLPGDVSTPENWRKIGIECIDRYIARHTPFDQTITLGLDVRLLGEGEEDED